MKTFISIFAFIFMLGVLPATSSDPKPEDKPGIKFFSGTWDDALKLAKKENKLIFLDVYATWCGPCKYLENTVYPDPSIGDIYKDSYLTVKIDGESEFGSVLAGNFNLEAFPSMYFLNSAGKLLNSIVGVKEAAELGKIGTAVWENRAELEKMAEVDDFSSYSRADLIRYHAMYKSIGNDDRASLIGTSIIPYLSASDVYKEEYKTLITGASGTIDSDIFKAIAADKSKATAWFGEEELDNYFSNVFQETLEKAVDQSDVNLVTRIVNEFLPVYLGSDPAELASGKFIVYKLYYAQKAEWDSFSKLVLNEYTANQAENEGFLYNESYNLLNDYSYDEEALLVSKNLMITAVGANPSFDNRILLAYIHSMSGENIEARLQIGLIREMSLTEDQKSMVDELEGMMEED